MIVTGSKEDKLLKLWSIDDLECVTTIKYKPDSISCLKLYVCCNLKRLQMHFLCINYTKLLYTQNN